VQWQLHALVRHHGLQTSEDRIVVGVRADPEPDKAVSVANRKRAVSEADAGGEDWLGGVNLLETEARMGRGIPELSVGEPGALLDVLR